MSFAVTNTTSVAIEEEVTEGTYVAPAGASSFLQILKSGFEMKPSKELLERDIFLGSIGQATPRTGTKSISGALPVECRAYSTEGAAPEFDKLLKACLGTRRQIATTTTTKASGNTATVLQIEDADISKYAVGDIVMTKGAGAFHVSPIIARSTGAGTATITLLVPHPAGDHADSVVISKMTMYTVAESGHPSLSVTKYVDSAVEDIGIGCRVSKMDLSDFATGKMPKLNFGFDGLDFDKSLTAPSFTPSYDQALPPLALDARLYMDATEVVSVNELALSIENTVSFATSFSAANGKISSRITARKVTGSMNPYQETDSIANFTKFVNNTEFALFACAKNPLSSDGEFGNVIAIYMPKVIITEAAEADADGLVQQNLSFQASRGAAGTTNEIYIAFI
jgi:hypothetical protein